MSYLRTALEQLIPRKEEAPKNAKSVQSVPWIQRSPWHDFTLEREIGHGQFGHVFMVRAMPGRGLEGQEEGSLYALKSISKVLPRASSIPPGDPRLREQQQRVRANVEREVDILTALKGLPNVVTLHAVYEDPYSFSLLFEACLGGELFDAIALRGFFSEREAASIIRVVLAVVESLHERGIVHRDLKPENFLLSTPVRGGVIRPAELVLCDFGLAQRLEEGGAPLRDMVGSSYYVAPEVIMRSSGPQADLWSCGVLLYLLLTGDPPFFAETDREILDQILFKPLRLSGADLGDAVSDGARDLLTRLLDRNPSRRLSASEALAHPWLNTEDLPPSPTSSLLGLSPKMGGGMGGTPPGQGGKGLAGGPPISCPEPERVSRLVAKRMHQFTHRTRLKQMILHFAALHLPVHSFGTLRDIFLSMDRDGDGLLTAEDLRTGFSRLGVDMDTQALSALLDKIDQDRDGKLSFENFLSATLDWRTSLNRQFLLEVFRLLDVEGDGFVSASDLREAFRDCSLDLDIKALRHMLEEHDSDRDDRLSLEEFLSLMQEDEVLEAVTPHQVQSVLRRLRSFPHRGPQRGEDRVGLLRAARASVREQDALTEGLRRIFSSLDKDNSGTLSATELLSAFSSSGVSGVTEPELRKIMESLDLDKDRGAITFEEFLAATKPQLQSLQGPSQAPARPMDSKLQALQASQLATPPLHSQAHGQQPQLQGSLSLPQPRAPRSLPQGRAGEGPEGGVWGVREHMEGGPRPGLGERALGDAAAEPPVGSDAGAVHRHPLATL